MSKKLHWYLCVIYTIHGEPYSTTIVGLPKKYINKKSILTIQNHAIEEFGELGLKLHSFSYMGKMTEAEMNHGE